MCIGSLFLLVCSFGRLGAWAICMYARISIRSFCTFSFTILIDADICPEAGFFGVEVGLKGLLRQWNLHVFSRVAHGFYTL